ncbi:MAG: hypothetical protein ACQ9MH_14655 [Nitrospinales bacterium]
MKNAGKYTQLSKDEIMLNYKEIKKLRMHDPFISGKNQSYFVTGFIPLEQLKKLLPENMSIPSDAVMAKEYPTMGKINGMHPILLLFSRCYHVHDVITKIEIRPYLELLFYFPVVYTHLGKAHLCSYLPVLYLDFLIGTLGGMFLGLRKQFHPGLNYIETETANTFILKDIISANFQQTPTENKKELDSFFTQIFKKPTVTVSYFNQTVFYTTSVQPTKVLDASADYEWKYEGTTIKNNEHTYANYCEYNFTTSWAMGYEKYFHPKYPMKEI